jgi:ABC-type cobalamin transport system ATPase subunit
VAVAALAVASLARAQAGLSNATAYANPVFEFLAAHQNAAALSATDIARLRQHTSTRQANAGLMHGVDSGAWQSMLPVLFVGLIAPLNLVSPSSELCLDRTNSAPALPFRFQRPPPPALI